MKITPFAALAILMAGATTGQAQMTHADHEAHAQSDAASTLSEPGQGAFAALSEVVRVLESDADTDWTRVDLGALRDHLVDMDRLVTHTVVREEGLDGGVRAIAAGDAATLATLRRMVPAHGHELAKDTRWDVLVSEEAGAVVLQVTSADPSVAARIRALGFFGLMASQDHHRAHHLRMARGADVHAH